MFTEEGIAAAAALVVKPAAERARGCTYTYITRVNTNLQRLFSLAVDRSVDDAVAAAAAGPGRRGRRGCW